LLLIPLFLLSEVTGAFAGSATWNLNPTNGEWDTASNWTPATVPNGPNDTATFGVSNITDINSTSNDYFNLEVNGIVFNAGASAFTIFAVDNGSFDNSLTISGVGIANNSGITQNFVVNTPGGVLSSIEFTNSATAGDLTVFTIGHDGVILFSGDSTGGTARVEVFGNGSLDICAHNAPEVTVGSIEGDGLVFLGANNLTVGSNSLSTMFSGVIQDGGFFCGSSPWLAHQDWNGNVGAHRQQHLLWRRGRC
jgi:hypothetical protein